jgi:hypothetical protein
MKQELETYLTADHFPKTSDEIEQFFVSSTLDAAILFHIDNYGREETWKNIFESPQKWSQSGCFVQMKETIKSIGRNLIFSAAAFDDSKNIQDTLQSIIFKVGGLEKAKECFASSNCEIPTGPIEPIKLKEFIMTSDGQVFDLIFQHIYYSNRMSPSSETSGLLDSWNPIIVDNEISVNGEILKLLKLVSSSRFMEYGFLGEYRGESVRILFRLSSNRLPYVGIVEEVELAKLAEAI